MTERLSATYRAAVQARQSRHTTPPRQESSHRTAYRPPPEPSTPAAPGAAPQNRRAQHAPPQGTPPSAESSKSTAQGTAAPSSPSSRDKADSDSAHRTPSQPPPIAAPANGARADRTRPLLRCNRAAKAKRRPAHSATTPSSVRTAALSDAATAATLRQAEPTPDYASPESAAQSRGAPLHPHTAAGTHARNRPAAQSATAAPTPAQPETSPRESPPERDPDRSSQSRLRQREQPLFAVRRSLSNA